MAVLFYQGPHELVGSWSLWCSDKPNPSYWSLWEEQAAESAASPLGCFLLSKPWGKLALCKPLYNLSCKGIMKGLTVHWTRSRLVAWAEARPSENKNKINPQKILGTKVLFKTRLDLVCKYSSKPGASFGRVFSITTGQAKQDVHTPGSFNAGNLDNHGKVLCFSSSRTKIQGAVLRRGLLG